MLWANLKAVELANLAAPTLAEVIDQAHKGIDRVRRTPHAAPGLLVPALRRPVGRLTIKPTPRPSGVGGGLSDGRWALGC
jgi:hypothetical protein